MPSEFRKDSDSFVSKPQFDLAPFLERARLAYMNENTGTDEGGAQTFRGDARMRDSAWFKSLPMREQLNLIGGLTLKPGDSGYDEMKAQTGGEAGRNLWITADAMGAPKQGDAEGYLNDGTNEYQGDGFFAHSEDQQRPGFQRKAHERFSAGKILAAAALPILGGAASQAMGLAGGGAMGTGAGVTGGLGAELGAAGASSAGAGATGAGATGLSFQNTGLSSLFQGTPSVAPGAATESLGGLSGLGANAGNLAPVTDLSVPAQGGNSLGSSFGSAASNYLKNPANIARLGMGLASLGGAAGNSTATASGASTDAGSIIDQMAQANRVNQNTPIGSRNWVKNADGTWTVNDTMSAPEQANFTNVQGMNADVTNMARQRLAALLAQPARSRADAPIMIGGRTIGG